MNFEWEKIKATPKIDNGLIFKGKDFKTFIVKIIMSTKHKNGFIYFGAITDEKNGIVAKTFSNNNLQGIKDEIEDFANKYFSPPKNNSKVMLEL